MAPTAAADLAAVALTLRLAATATVILLIGGTPLAWWLARTRSPARTPVEALVAMPLVLPPTVLGYYLLVGLGPHSPVGAAWLHLTGSTLPFTFAGLVAGSVLYSLPFVVQPLQAAFEAQGRAALEAAATLRAGPIDRFFTVAVPLARRGFLTAATLGFAHTVGEFGVVLMIGGGIPGRTLVASIAVYNHVQDLQYARADLLSAGLLAFSFLVLLMVYTINRRLGSRTP